MEVPTGDIPSVKVFEVKNIRLRGSVKQWRKEESRYNYKHDSNFQIENPILMSKIAWRIPTFRLNPSKEIGRFRVSDFPTSVRRSNQKVFTVTVYRVGPCSERQWVCVSSVTPCCWSAASSSLRASGASGGFLAWNSPRALNLKEKWRRSCRKWRHLSVRGESGDDKTEMRICQSANPCP